jgi:hypothetical protein
MRGSPKPADTKVAIIETWGNSVNLAIPFRSISLAALARQHVSTAPRTSHCA